MEDMVKNDWAFFRGKRVLVTGDTGFKGSWLAYWLYRLGADVVGFALPAAQENGHFCALQLNRLIHHVDGDIRDFSSVQKISREFAPEILFHLAAQPLVRASYRDPKETFDTNVGGSVNMLETIREARFLRSVIFVTSDKCYRNNEWVWGYRENDELGGRDPYSASKAAAEVVFSSYFQSYFASQNTLGLASVRAGNVIGGGDWSEDRIIPDCVRSLMEGRPILLRNPQATRPWQHVLEPLGGYLLLAKKMFESPKSFSGAWNFGPDISSAQTVDALVGLFIQLWGDGSIETAESSQGFHEAKLLFLNCDKARQLLGWYPKWNFQQTITETVEWYTAVSAGSPAQVVTERQINKYMEDGFYD